MVDCVHHYKIESPNGNKYLHAMCIKCDNKRLFKASFIPRSVSLIEKELREKEEIKYGYIKSN